MDVRRPLCVSATQYGDLVYFSCGSPQRVLSVDAKSFKQLKLRSKANIDFALCALFRLEPYFGRFPESKESKEKVIKAQYGKPLKPGCKCSLSHILTTMYLAKTEAIGSTGACLTAEKAREGETSRLPDITLSVVSKEAWKDVGIADGSQVVISVFEAEHRFQLISTQGKNVSFAFTPREFEPMYINCFLFWDARNGSSAKYGFACQLKTNCSMYLAAKPNTRNSARLSLLEESEPLNVLPEFWGEVQVDLTSSEGDGNSYWVVEKPHDAFSGGIICGGEPFILKHIFSRKYLGADFRLTTQSAAQVLMFPYSGKHSPEWILEQLKTKTEIESHQPEDVVEMFEQYPLVKASAETEEQLVSRSTATSKDRLWSSLLLPFAWRLRPGLVLRSELTYLAHSMPDSLLKFEVREADPRSTFLVAKVAGKIRGFARLHRRFESNPASDSESPELMKRSPIVSQSTLSLTESRLEAEEDQANVSIAKIQAIESAMDFFITLEGLDTLSELPSLLAVRGVSRREALFMMDAQIFTETLRFVMLVLTGSQLSELDKDQVRRYVSALFPRPQLVWSHLHANSHLLLYLAQHHRSELLKILSFSKEYQQPLREEVVQLITLLKEGVRDEELDQVIATLDPDAALRLLPQPFSLTELFTRKIYEINRRSFAELLSESTQREKTLRDSVGYWEDWISQIEHIDQAADRAERLALSLDSSLVSERALLTIMQGVLGMLKQLVEFKVKQDKVKMKSNLLEDRDDVRRFIQAAFKLIQTYQHWVTSRVVDLYRSGTITSYESMETYIRENLTLEALAARQEQAQSKDSDGLRTILLEQLAKKRPAEESQMMEASVPLLSKDNKDTSMDQSESPSRPAPVTNISQLLITIAKYTRFRVRDKPGQLLEMIEAALNPAHNAAKVIEKILPRDEFINLSGRIQNLRRGCEFYAVEKDRQFDVEPREHLDTYLARLEELRMYLDNLQQTCALLRTDAVDDPVQCMQEVLSSSGFGEELRRLWSYCAVLAARSEEPFCRLRVCTFALSYFYILNNHKTMKFVFGLLSPATFFIDYPEYVKLLIGMNVIPLDDNVVLDLQALIERTSEGARADAAKQELAKFASLQMFQGEASDSSAQKPAQPIPGLLQLVETVSKKRKMLAHVPGAIALLFDQRELYEQDLYEKMKTVFLNDNLVKRYLQTWRYIILAYRATLKLSEAVGKKRSIAGLMLGQKDEEKRSMRESRTKKLTSRMVLESREHYKHILARFNEEELRMLQSQDLTLFSKKDILYIAKRWQVKMQNLLERIIDYVCRSSNVIIQKEELEVLGEMVKDNPDAKLAVIHELGRYRQYRYFFGLFASIMEKRNEARKSEAEKQEIRKLKLAFLRFFQASCDGCFSPFQNYMREQNEGQKDNINLIDVMARKLEDLIVDSHSALSAGDSELAAELAVTLLEAVSGPCAANIQVVSKYQRLLRGVGFFVTTQIKGIKKDKAEHSATSEDGVTAVKAVLSKHGRSNTLLECRLDAERSLKPQQSSVIELRQLVNKIHFKFERQENSRKLALDATRNGVKYPKLAPGKLLLCTDLVNLLIALLEGNERRPERIMELMPAVEFKQFQSLSNLVLDGISEDFFRNFETGVFTLDDYDLADPECASPGQLMTFAMRCCILYYTTLHEDEMPKSRNKILRYIASVEIQQPGQDPGKEEIHSVIFQVPFKALHLSWLDTFSVLAELSSSSREENLKNFVGHLETYIGEMRYLQRLSQLRVQNYLRVHWKHIYWGGYLLLVAINALILVEFDGLNYEEHVVDYASMIFSLGMLHSLLRGVWTYCYYVRYAYLIWYPLTGVEEENSLEQLARSRNPGTIAAYFGVDLSPSMISARIKGITKALLNIGLVPLSIFAMYHPWVYPFLLLEVSSMESTLENIIKAITNRYKQLLLTFGFAILIMYLYAVLAYFFFSSQFDTERGALCSTLSECILTTVNLGMRSDGGVGDLMQTSDMPFRVLYDMSFFILITTILMAIVFGIVVDTFGQLRDEMNEAERNMTSICSICRQPRSSIEIRGEGWDRHCLLTHNPFAYLYFMAYVKEKDMNDCSGVEKYVRQQLDRNDIGFFPTTFRPRNAARD